MGSAIGRRTVCACVFVSGSTGFTERRIPDTITNKGKSIQWSAGKAGPASATWSLKGSSGHRKTLSKGWNSNQISSWDYFTIFVVLVCCTGDWVGRKSWSPFCTFQQRRVLLTCRRLQDCCRSSQITDLQQNRNGKRNYSICFNRVLWKNEGSLANLLRMGLAVYS